ncbi:MAG: DUF349 domain-containing protein, partial [Actinomycetota bacterium]
PRPRSDMPEIPTPAALRPPARATVGDVSGFGRVDPDGTVYLLAPEGEVVVGQYAAGTPDEGLAFFSRKYADLVLDIDLAITRLRDGRGTPESGEQALTRVTEALTARSFVGDIPALEAKCAQARELIDHARVAAKERREQERQASLAARTALAEEAESLASSTSWRVTSERFTAIVEEWNALPRGDRASEQALGKRLSGSRAAFDKARRAHFATLDVQRKEALGTKRDLIAQAEKLATSTDFGPTTRKFRDLLDQWKRAPRGSRSDEDKLWKRFKAAQDTFYSSMKAADAAKDAALAENVPAKEELVVQAEALLPPDDLKKGKTALRAIQQKWDALGDVPKGDRNRLEARLKKVEDAFRDAERERWKESTTQAVPGAQAFTDALGRLEEQLESARRSGNNERVTELEASIASTRALLQAAGQGSR